MIILIGSGTSATFDPTVADKRHVDIEGHSGMKSARNNRGRHGRIPAANQAVNTFVSMRVPGLVAGMTLLSEPMRHLNWMFCPAAAAGKLTTW